MKRILDEDDLLSIQDTIQREIDENSFSDNYATSDRQGGAAISTKVNSATSGNFKVLLTDDSVDTHGGKQLYQDTDLIYDAGTNTINTNVTHANTANYFSEAKKIELSGDVTGSASSNGESGWNIGTSLAKIIDETTAGPNDTLLGYTIDIPYIEVDEKGRVTSLINKQFTVPKPTVDTSGFLTKDKFGDIDNNPVSKKEENNKIIYYHDNKTITTPTPEPATELKYGEEFNFTALSAADSYGHVNQKTTYKFKMPAAPSGNTTGIITKNDFTANAPLSVTKSEDNNTVTYSHNKPTADTSLKSDGPPKTGNDVNISLSYGNTTSFTALSGIDEYGHAIQKTKYKIAMPAAPAINTNIITISEHKFAYASKSGIHQWGGKTGTANDSITYIGMDLGTFRGCYITVCPNVTGYTFNGTYDDENNESTPIVDVRLFLPGSLTFFTNSLSDFSFKLPRFYALTPTKEAYHGFSYLGKSGAICHLGYSNKQIALYFSCEKSYFNPTLIDKIIITTY